MPIDTVLFALTGITDTDVMTDLTIDVADQTGATVIIGKTYPESEHASAQEEIDIESPDDLARRDANVEDVATAFENAGVPYEIRGALGDEGEGHVVIADSVDADRILIQGQQRSPTGKAVFGSVAQHVLLNAPCPVTFVRQ